MVEIDSITERLEVEEDYKPLKLLGLKATYGLLNSIYTGIATLGAAVLQKSYGWDSQYYSSLLLLTPRCFN